MTALISDSDLSECQELLGYRFKDTGPLIQALTHPTFAYEALNDNVRDNQRLEFLGDSVLNMVAAEYLYMEYPDYSEGRLTKSRSMLVNNNLLVERAKGLNISRFILLGKGEEKQGGRQNAANLASALEAIIGAIYLDGGMDSAMAFIREKFLNNR
jgi:ribonuclease-3